MASLSLHKETNGTYGEQAAQSTHVTMESFYSDAALWYFFIVCIIVDTGCMLPNTLEQAVNATSIIPSYFRTDDSSMMVYKSRLR